LARAAGARESRYAHLFSGSIESVEEPEGEESAADAPTLSHRVRLIEEELKQLRAELDALKAGRDPARPATTEG
jgi:uncharacterized protein YceH (UPF0502 family)